MNLLVSFKSIDEISRECLRYVDIVDLKSDLGAIGSWEIKDIKKVIEDFGSKQLISATIGDEKNIKKNVVKKLLTYDQLNLDFIKFGIFRKQ